MEAAELNLRLERKVQQLQALIDLGRALAGVAEPGDVLRRFGLTLAGQWALRRWGVLAIREGQDPLVGHRGLEPLARRADELAGPSRRAFSGWRAPVRLRGDEPQDDPLLRELSSFGVEAVVPLLSGETVLGFAALGERPGRAPWTDDDLEHAAGLAAQAVIALEGTWQSQEASHWRRISEAKDQWRQLDAMARLVFLAVARLGASGPPPSGRGVGALVDLLAEAGATVPEAQIASALERLVASGALSRGAEGALTVERTGWLLLPEARLPLAEIARGTRRRVGAYELMERIGSGGMGDVYRAENVFDRSVAAVKLLSDPIGEDEDLRGRFEREGAIVAHLSHPNIVRLLERGEHEGRLYLAMELLDGEPLSARIRRGPMPVEEALAGVRDLASALAALHTREVIHRDVKSSNIMRTSAGRWVLLDFGLARSLVETTRTVKGSLLGTLPYMSPEGILGKPCGKSADVWALGVVLFELLMGRLPWEAQFNATLVVEITQSRADVAPVLTPVAGAEVASLVERMLEPDATRRIPDGLALLAALKDIGPASGARAPSPAAAGQDPPTERLDVVLGQER